MRGVLTEWSMSSAILIPDMKKPRSKLLGKGRPRRSRCVNQRVSKDIVVQRLKESKAFVLKKTMLVTTESS